MRCSFQASLSGPPGEQLGLVSWGRGLLDGGGSLMSGVEAGREGVKVYRGVDELPETLEPGRYIVEGEELEVLEPLCRDAVAEIIRFFRGRCGHVFV